MSIKVTIIENQHSHYDEFLRLFQNNSSDQQFEICPSPDEYLKIADLARVSLDCRYKLEILINLRVAI